MSFISKAIRVTAAVGTLGGSELTGAASLAKHAKDRSNDKHQAHVMADAIRMANGEPTAKESKRQANREQSKALLRSLTKKG